MSDNKVELGDLKSSARFYFPHDPFKIVWKKSNDKRKSGANQVFFYCEDPQGNIEDFNANRSVIYLPGDQLPVFGEEAVIPPVTFPVKKSKTYHGACTNHQFKTIHKIPQHDSQGSPY